MNKQIPQLKEHPQRRRNQRGAVAIIVGLMMVVLVGMLGLAVDFGYAYVRKNQLQNVADAEALACVISPSATPCPAGTTVGDNYPAVNTYGFTIVSTENPGDNSLCPLPTQRNCARVTVSQTWNTFFIPVFGRPTLTAQVSAIAGKTGGGVGCVIASTYFSVQGSMGLNGTNCANYFGDVSVTGNPPISGSANYVYNGNSAASCTTCLPPAVSVSGPLVAPAPSPAVYNPSVNGTFSGDWQSGGSASTSLVCQSKGNCVLLPGTFNNVDCSASQATCTLQPNGSASAVDYTFEINGTFAGPSNNGSMSGAGVVLYFGGPSGQMVTLGGGGQLTLSAPYTGACGGSNTPTSQIVVYAPNATLVAYGGNVASRVTGNIYMPNASFSLSGNGGLTMAGTLVSSSYADAGGGNSGLTVDGTNACGFAPAGAGSVVLVD